MNSIRKCKVTACLIDRDLVAVQYVADSYTRINVDFVIEGLQQCKKHC